MGKRLSWNCIAVGVNHAGICTHFGMFEAQSEAEAIGHVTQAFQRSHDFHPSSTKATGLDPDDLLNRWIAAQDFEGGDLEVFETPAKSNTGFRRFSGRLLTYNLVEAELIQ